MRHYIGVWKNSDFLTFYFTIYCLEFFGKEKLRPSAPFLSLLIFVSVSLCGFIYTEVNILESVTKFSELLRLSDVVSASPTGWLLDLPSAFECSLLLVNTVCSAGFGFVLPLSRRSFLKERAEVPPGWDWCLGTWSWARTHCSWTVLPPWDFSGKSWENILQKKNQKFIMIVPFSLQPHRNFPFFCVCIFEGILSS